MGNIFISYSHKDEKWVSDWLVPRLEEAGLAVCVDYRDFKIGAVILHSMRDAVNNCSGTVLVLTQNWIESEWTQFEALLLPTKDPLNLKGRILPIMLEQCTPPDELAIFNYADFKDKNKWDAQLARLIKQLGINKVETDNISISKLPTTGEFLLGREKELQALDDAWTETGTHVVTIIAWGGVGKTALVNRWLSNMAGKGYCGAKRVYGWSFYSQGAQEGKQASADEFLQEALKWFGDADPTEGSAVDKGRRLARLVRKERTLLILDGMEPLQYPPGECHGMDGKLKDQGMRTFLRELAGGFTGLCVVTSRETVTDLADWKKGTVKEMELEHLPDDAGLAYLKKLGVTGSNAEMVKAVREYGGHALALTLLGRYIKTVYHGDIRQRDRISALTKEHLQGRHAWKVLAAYETWLGASPQRDILYIMGLFDRPAEGGAIAALREEPAIPEVTEQLAALEEEEWQAAVSHLREARLLADENPQKPGTLDCHPLVREYFGAVLQKQNPEGWQEAHKRLYQYFKGVPKKELPDTLQEMEPLFAAVAHGCRAELHQQALYDVYWNRIYRGKEAYLVHKLGAFGSYLSVLANFFEKPWSKPAAGLKEVDKALVLSWSAFGLRAVGRLREASQAMIATLERYKKIDDVKEIAIAASNLSALLLSLGEVTEAVDYGRQSVAYADDSGNADWQFVSRTTLADALHQAGERAEAEKLFREAEEKQKQREPDSPYLYSQRGYQFCDLLLDLGDFGEVLERAEKTIEIAIEERHLLSIALDNLSLGRARQQKTVHENSGDFSTAWAYLDRAVAGLREAAHQEFLARGLLARAECYRLSGQFEKARQDLDEAREIAASGEMKLHLVDYHLEAARLCRAEGQETEAEGHNQEAAALIEETGYFRRKFEVQS